MAAFFYVGPPTHTQGLITPSPLAAGKAAIGGLPASETVVRLNDCAQYQTQGGDLGFYGVHCYLVHASKHCSGLRDVFSLHAKMHAFMGDGADTEEPNAALH
jgi:hypothetical protein